VREGGLQHSAADAFEDHVDAARREAGQRLADVSRLVIDDVVAPQRTQCARLLLRRAGANYGAAGKLRKLYRKVPRTARSRGDQHRLAGLDLSRDLHHRAGGEAGDAQRRHFGGGLRNPPERPRLGCGVLGKTAAHEAHSIAFGKALDGAPNGRNNTNALCSQRKAAVTLTVGRKGKLSARTKRLAATVDAGVHDLHEHLILGKLFERNLGDLCHVSELLTNAAGDKGAVGAAGCGRLRRLRQHRRPDAADEQREQESWHSSHKRERRRPKAVQGAQSDSDSLRGWGAV